MVATPMMTAATMGTMLSVAMVTIAAETPIMAVVPIAPIKATGKGKKKPDSTAAPTAATAQ